MDATVHLRRATALDIPALRHLIDASVRVLQAGDYSPEQIEGALGTVFGVDTRLIEDATYFVAEAGAMLAGCGGWSKRKTLFGSDHGAGREDALLDPAVDAARIRHSSSTPTGPAAASAAGSSTRASRTPPAPDSVGSNSARPPPANGCTASEATSRSTASRRRFGTERR